MENISNKRIGFYLAMIFFALAFRSFIIEDLLTLIVFVIIALVILEHSKWDEEE